jgi:phosphatidylserine/phosphatidylglycerophosphate/cardiolipin synthase-like enzyme
MEVSLEYLEDEHIYERVVQDGILKARTSLWIATANVKDMRVKVGRTFQSIVHILAPAAERGLDVRLLHSAKPSFRFIESLRKEGTLFPMRRCPRTHFKTVIIDGASMFLGSANLTGAGIGAKKETRRNFEVGIWTHDAELIDRVQSLFNLVWEGEECGTCALRPDTCPGIEDQHALEE